MDRKTQPLIILSDGTWAGREANTKTNIYLLAKMVGIRIDDPTDTDIHVLDGFAWYMHGVGLGSSFVDYVFNGVTGQDIAEQSIAVYKFIVYNYSYPERQLWMFGFSRGSFLVRTVAGMINNCGIIKRVVDKDNNVDDAQTDLLCRQVYSIYRSDDPINHPHSEQSYNFRKRASWDLIGDEEDGEESFIPPVKFMGIFDTVGSLGIPEYVGGVGLDWPKFHDQNVSTVVDLVYHALGIHDRLYTFPPCHARRSLNPRENQQPVQRLMPERAASPQRPENFGITERWFPGVHYDLGRHRFRFLRVFGGGLLERLLARWNWASKEVRPNEVLSNLVLKWMLEAVRDNDPEGGVIPCDRIRREIAEVSQGIVQDNRQTGDGDVYSRIVQYIPFGTLISSALTALWGSRWQTNQIYQLLFATRPRLIADLHASVYDFTAVDPDLSGANRRTIQTLADLDNVRYPSDTYEAWNLRRNL